MLVSFSDLALASVAVGLFSAAAGWVRIAQSSINPEAFLMALARLCGAGNFSRMRKLCNAAGPKIPSGVAMQAVCLHCAGAPPPQQEAGSYRDGGANPHLEAEREIRQVYWQAAAPVLKSASWALLPWSGSAATLAAACALWPPLQMHPRVEWWFQIGLGASSLLLVSGLRSWWALREGTKKIIAAMAMPLARAWVEGRFKEEAEKNPPPEPHRPSSPPPAGTLVFEVHEPGQETRMVEVPRASVLKIGRMQSSHLRLTHPSVARVHAVLEEQGPGWQLIDLGSASGTVLNGEQVNKAPLGQGDTLLLGEVVVRLAASG